MRALALLVLGAMTGPTGVTLLPDIPVRTEGQHPCIVLTTSPPQYTGSCPSLENGIDVVTLTAMLSSSDAGTPEAVLVTADAGAPDAQLQTFQHLEQLALDYNCPQADPPKQFEDGSALLGADRVTRNNCLMARMSSEVFSFRDQADAGTLTTSSKAWIVTSVVCVLSALASGYEANRAARHLPLWP
jgi:hypothetical protein